MALPAVTEIKLSKRKLTYWLLFVVFLLGATAYTFTQADTTTISGVHNPTLIRLIAGTGAVLFLALGALLVRKLTNKLPGLVLSSEGFVNNTTGAQAGLVAWGDVAGLQDVEMGFSKFLAVQLRDPAAYISQYSNQMTRRILEGNLKTYGSPLLLSVSNLECTYDEVRLLFAQYLAAYKASK